MRTNRLKVRSFLPGEPTNPAPDFAEFIEDLIHRYILDPDHPGWPEKWARVYDQTGVPRYMVSILHTLSTQPGISDQTFAEGFDTLADTIYNHTGVRVGFALDIIPDDFAGSGEFRANPETTGPYLAEQQSILAVQCFIPEITLGMTHEPFMTRWKHQFSSRWVHTGIPVIQDISAGYDAHIVFPGSVIYGNNPDWREASGQIVHKLQSQGITFNTWNGYTEDYAGMPTEEFGAATYQWVGDHFKNFEPATSLHKVPGRIEAEDWSEMSGIETDVALDDFKGLYAGWMNEGDRIDYHVDIQQEGVYYLDMRIARLVSNPKGEVQIRLDDNAIKTIDIPGTGGYQDWQTIHSSVALSGGRHKLGMYITGGDWNLNWMKFKHDSVEHYHMIPGRIEAEDYDDMSGVVSERSTEQSSEVNVGFLDDGDWMKYYVDVEQNGSYRVSFRVAQGAGLNDTEGALYSGDTLLCNFTVPGTGDWQNWLTVHRNVDLTEGKQKLRILVTNGPWNINWLYFSLLTSAKNGIEDHLTGNVYQNSEVSIDVCDVRGRRVTNLYHGNKEAGLHEFTWNAGNMEGSVYFVRIQAGDRTEVIKCILSH